MIWKTIWIIGTLLVIAVVSGCSDDASPEAEWDPPVKTAEQLEAEAEAQITPDNWQDELDRLEREIEQDMEFIDLDE